MKLVLDANVIVSAVLFGGKPREVLSSVAAGRVQGCTSDALIRELQEVLQREKFGLEMRTVQAIISEVSAMSEWTTPTEQLGIISEDPSDNHVLECAVAAAADYVVTGDRHLLELGTYRGICIIQPERMATLLAEKLEQG
jgi:uncharacterized protein